ncbi:hypothetical protein [Shewanella inventionis]|nr:hypothetical protein [Shewanella inventionis]
MKSIVAKQENCKAKWQTNTTEINEIEMKHSTQIDADECERKTL